MKKICVFYAATLGRTGWTRSVGGGGYGGGCGINRSRYGLSQAAFGGSPLSAPANAWELVETPILLSLQYLQISMISAPTTRTPPAAMPMMTVGLSSHLQFSQSYVYILVHVRHRVAPWLFFMGPM